MTAYPSCRISKEIDDYLRLNPETGEQFMAVSHSAEELIQDYDAVLTAEQRIEARKSIWGKRSVGEYVNAFRSILSSFYLSDKTLERYEAIREAIREKNPEWLSSFEATAKNYAFR